jgi:hypothetical protein
MLAQGLQQELPNRLKFYWLRNLSFDSAFLLLPLLTGIFFAALCNNQPALFVTVLFFDLWLLGYHHVISTYTRIAFDWTSARANGFLVFILPILVLTGTVALYKFFGSWIIVTVYYYWQWFHYTRQSYGVSRYYLGRAGNPSSPLYRPIHTMALYAIPVTGILYRSWQDQKSFLSMELWNIPVPFEMVAIAAMLSIALISYQLFSWWKLYQAGELHGSYVIYMLSHHLIFLTGYMLIDNISIGWLAINMWHNMQYILFVWMQNNNKYRNGIDPAHQFISWMSQDGRIRMFLYMLICVAITYFIYQVLMAIGIIVYAKTAISISIITFMTLNFHHYIVDSIIWKRKAVKKIV